MGNKSFVNSPFAKLKKQLEQSRPAPAPPPPKENKEEYSDEELFGSAMKDVQEIAEFRSLTCSVPLRKKQSSGAPRSNPDKEVLGVLAEIADGHRPINLSDTQEYIEWVNPEFHDMIISRLHEGRFAVQAYLDLHGFTVSGAPLEIDEFLDNAFAKGLSCVKIIHGRGLRSVRGPRIKDLVIRRLLGRYRKQIIAFATARQCDGGLGALYVLLKKSRP